MFNLAVTFIAAALLAPSATVGQTLSACVTNCTTLALPAGGCTAITDLACVCNSTDVFTSAAACITQDCPDELATAEDTLTQTCDAFANGTETGSTSDAGTGSSTSAAVVTPGGTTTRASVTPGTTTRPATTSTSSRSSSSSTATTSTGAGFHTASIASGVTLALFGAAFSLF